MPSHLTAHNTPAPPGTLPAATMSRRWKLLYAAAGLLCFIALDRLTPLALPPAYRSVPDRRLYHTLDTTVKMQRLAAMRDSLETVVIGDSRARHGVDPSLWSGQGDPERVTAFNLAPASSGVDFTDMFVREYLMDLPRIKTVVWGVSPRIFNRYWKDEVYDFFRASGGYKHDRQIREQGAFLEDPAHWAGSGLLMAADRGLAGLSAAYNHRSLLKPIALDFLARESKRFTPDEPMPVSPWGAIDFPASRTRDMTDENEIAKNLARVEGGSFRLDIERVLKFKRLIGDLESRGIRVVCFIPPMHGRLRDSPAADDDGTPDEDYKDLVEMLAGFEKEYSNYHFLDCHRDGRHGFPNEEFGDFDHLNAAGRRRLSAKLDEKLAKIADEPPREGVQRKVVSPPKKTAKTLPSTASAKDGPPVIVSHLGWDAPGVQTPYWDGILDDNAMPIWADYTGGAGGVDLDSVRMFMDGVDITAKCVITPTRVTYTPSEPFVEAQEKRTMRFKVTVRDKAGNAAEFNWTIFAKGC
jgi:hypothetical protein